MTKKNLSSEKAQHVIIEVYSLLFVTVSAILKGTFSIMLTSDDKSSSPSFRGVGDDCFSLTTTFRHTD